MRARRSARWVAAAMTLSIAACTTLRTAPDSRHAIESRRLPRLMRDLETLSYARLPQAMDLSQERTRRIGKVVRVATAIAESAAQLEHAVVEESFSASELRVFARHAEMLERRAESLARRAPSLTSEEIRASAAAIEATCSGCHRLLGRAPFEPMAIQDGSWRFERPVERSK